MMLPSSMVCCVFKQLVFGMLKRCLFGVGGLTAFVLPPHYAAHQAQLSDLPAVVSVSQQVVDRAVIKDKETHKYCLRSSGGDIRVMLVWYDPPAAISTGDGSASTLINDLDLAVTSAGMGGQILLGNHGQTKDSRNTAERVWLRNVPAGGLEITVSAAINVPDGTPQNYSLVVQGAFAGELASPYNPDPAANAATPGGCPAQLMQSTAPTSPDASGTAALTTMVAPANVTATTEAVNEAAGAAVDMSAARVVDPVPPGSATSASPAAEELPASPSPSPGVDSSALVDMLISTMTTPASPPPASGRRLTWLPSPPSALTVRVPDRICNWLSAAGLAPEHYAHESDRVLSVPLGAVVVVGGCLLLAAVALFSSPSVRHYGIGRSTSLTSALREDLTKNSCKGSRKQREGQESQLEQLLPTETSFDAAAAEAAAVGGSSRSSSRILQHTNSSSTPSTCGTSSSKPGTPTSPSALRSKSQCGNSPVRQGSLSHAWPGSHHLPGVHSCPGSIAFVAPQQADAAAIAMPEYMDADEHNAGGSSSSCSFSHMLEDAARPYSRSFSAGGTKGALQPAVFPAWPSMMPAAAAGQDVQGQGPQRLRSVSAPGLPPRMPHWQQQQQQQDGVLLQGGSAPLSPQQAAAAVRHVRRSSSFTLALSSKQQQQLEVPLAGLLMRHDAEMPRDQQDFAHS
jgi:hypothetical protein